MDDLISRSALYEDIRRRSYISKPLAEIFETIIDEQPTIEVLSVVYGEGIPTLTEKEKQEPQLIIKECGLEFHFSYGELLQVLP